MSDITKTDTETRLPNESVVSSSIKNSQPGILLVEDDRVDIMTVQRALRRNQLDIPLHVARNGVEALAILRGETNPKVMPRPGLVVLDLNLPRMNGIEFLREFQADTDLNSIPVVVLTSSDEPKDRALAYQYDIDDYLIKPDSFREFDQLIHTVLSYWTESKVTGKAS